ncbi:60S ribosomal protein L22 [Diplonema papillatum]|nr:60S ribosomal protein L22 [Diplonema papillatum]|eukprot:gene21430-32970_t
MPKQQKNVQVDSRVRRAEAGKLVYKIDCSIPTTDGLIDADLLNKYATFLSEHLKIEGKTGQLGDKVKITVENDTIVITAFKVLFAKRYLKFLTRKFLRQEKLKEYVRLVSTCKRDYQLRYYNIHLDEEAAEE